MEGICLVYGWCWLLLGRVGVFWWFGDGWVVFWLLVCCRSYLKWDGGWDMGGIGGGW